MDSVIKKEVPSEVVEDMVQQVDMQDSENQENSNCIINSYENNVDIINEKQWDNNNIKTANSEQENILDKNQENKQEKIQDNKQENKQESTHNSLEEKEIENEKTEQVLSKDNQNIDTQDNKNLTTTQDGSTTQQVYNDQDWQSKVNEFLQNFPKSEGYVSMIGQEILGDSNLQSNPNCLEIAYARVMNKLYAPPCEIINDQDFREKYVFNNQEITSRIIEKYLSNLESNKAPKSILTRGQIILSPPDKPRSIEEAGVIIKNMLHNRRI